MYSAPPSNVLRRNPFSQVTVNLGYKKKSPHPDFKIHFTLSSSSGPPRKKRKRLTLDEELMLKKVEVEELKKDIILKDEKIHRLLGIIKKYEDSKSN